MHLVRYILAGKVIYCNSECDLKMSYNFLFLTNTIRGKENEYEKSSPISQDLFNTIYLLKKKAVLNDITLQWQCKTNGC